MHIKITKMKANYIYRIIPCSLLVTLFFSSIIFNGAGGDLSARENIGGSNLPVSNHLVKSVESGCINATAQADLDINSVRAKILNGGDMWWDIFGAQNAAYAVPKPPVGQIGPSSQFASSVWVGGYDAGGQLKVAAQTYRQSGNDYWPGPLTSTATTDPATCIAWDKFYKINRADVETYYNWVALGSNGANPLLSGQATLSNAMDVINNWPAYGPEGQPLAPYYDVNNDGIYDPAAGDVPDFDITGTRGCAAKLYGDQCLFWVFNDKGNIHTETGGASIGLEVQAQAFAFATNDELNNATFLKYKIINKSSFRLDSTFFGIWDDADLGFYMDDYVGCDVGLGLGILYNGTAIDGSGQATAYGANPPAIGVDFFEGPFADPDGHDNAASSVPSSFLNYGDGIADNERLGMCKFMYFENTSSAVNGNPMPGDDHYQYLTGTWRNGTGITYGGNGTSGSVRCNYMFPGLSDPSGFGVGGTLNNPITMPNWDMVSSSIVPNDMRFLESSGPFTLQPGAVNVITVGVPWARATQGGPLASVALLKGADAKAQLLFNNCFATTNGPTAPALTIQELNRQLILTWTNPVNSNNYNESYSEDYDKANPNNLPYTFQGYQLYQLRDGFVTQADLYNVDKARLVMQCDKVDGISQIVNYTNDVTISALVPQEMVNGSNKGIVHSVSLSDDLFATGTDARLVNHKTYYYAIIAYGFSQSLVPTNFGSLQDYKPYIAGRKCADFPVFTPHPGIPHIPAPEAEGTVQQSNYGSGPKLTRIEGSGNGANVLDFTSETVDAIFADPEWKVKNPVYENGKGPVTIKVIDPLNVPAATNFRFIMKAKYPVTGVAAFIPQDSSRWELINLNTGESVNSDSSIIIPNEQLINGQNTGSIAIIPKWGLSVNVRFAYSPGPTRIVVNGTPPNTTTSYFYDEPNNAFQEATMTFSDPSKQWLTGVPDQDGTNDQNWIRAGTQTFPAPNAIFGDDQNGLDNEQHYEKVLGGTWAPYRLCAASATTIPNPIVCSGGPAWATNLNVNKIKNVSSIDVVITRDKSKWTRCPVLEMQEEPALAIGNIKKLNMRSSLSVDQNGVPAIAGSGSSTNKNDPNFNGETGMGWFPGYAINLETGERLNMAFGEDSWLASENGADMKWNPTATDFSYPNFATIFGGKHYIYVFGHNGNGLFNGDTYMGNGFRDLPSYDEGKAMRALMAAVQAGAGDGYKREVFKDAMWVNIPLLSPMFPHLKLPEDMPSDVKVRLRVTKAYSKFGTGNQVSSGSLVTGSTYFVESGPITHNAVSVAAGATFVAANASWTSSAANASVLSTVNNADPIYEFNTSDIGTIKADAATAKSALDLINIVPNPYYAYSAYEVKTSDNIVKITNLPSNCTISIYTLKGTLIRTLQKNDGDAKASVDWDLKNQARIPIASGLYIIDVSVPNVGEKILKWFGVMRPLDLEAY